jgi:ribosomal protein S14
MSMLMLQRTKPQNEEPQNTYTIVCAWCGRERHRSTWRKFQLPRLGKRAEVSHGICPECYERQIAKLHTAE